MRRRMSPGRDKRVFTNTARKIKTINYSPTLHRGGFCL